MKGQQAGVGGKAGAKRWCSYGELSEGVGGAFGRLRRGGGGCCWGGGGFGWGNFEWGKFQRPQTLVRGEQLRELKSWGYTADTQKNLLGPTLVPKTILWDTQDKQGSFWDTHWHED